MMGMDELAAPKPGEPPVEPVAEPHVADEEE
jgi:hypothetical protein